MQMVRRDWLNLNGLWDLKLADGDGRIGRDEVTEYFTLPYWLFVK